MIVDPDFFDHWRTRMVADMLQDQLAPVYIMRLWAHCQNRKGDVFDIPAAGLKALCQFSGTAQDLEDALIAAEYITRDGLTVTVTGWAEKNAALLAAWENGKKGGRPKKNQNATDGQPTENPSEHHWLPMDNPSLTQTKPIRVEKSRVNTQPIGCGDETGVSPPADANGVQTSRQTADNCPHQQIIDLYHQTLPTGRQVREWTPARQAALRSRWRENPKRQTLDWWGRYFAYCAQSKFLTGQTHSQGRRPFELSLDWLVKSENMAKVIEGAYHEAETEAA